MLGGDWGEVEIFFQITAKKLNHSLSLSFQMTLNLDIVQVDVGASSEGGEVWGGSAQLLGLRPATQYEVILLSFLDGDG